MTKVVVHHLLGFSGGVILTLSFIVGTNHGLWPWDFTAVDFLALHASVSALGPKNVFFCALVALLTALTIFYWGDAAALADRILERTRLSSLRSGATSRPRPFGGPSDVNAVREELEKQLGRLIVLIAGQLGNSQDYIVSLKDTNAQLDSVASAAELREVVRTLISKNELNEHQTRDLETRLREAQEQAAKLRRRLNKAEKLASLDPLTQVANRRRFEQFIGAEAERSHEEGTPLCLVMTDIDHFKSVNDSHGHTIGDEVLKKFAGLLAKTVRSTDLVARFGGEEFAIVLPRTPMGNAFEIAERVRASFQTVDWSAHLSEEGVGPLTASFGIAEIRDGEPPSALIDRADKKLYEAKTSGRNRTAIWSTSE